MKLLNEILGTRYPIIQGGMANIATGEFAAACSNGGALGVIAGGGLQSGEALRKEIADCRARTDKPFGVNIMLMHPLADEFARIAAEEKVPVVTTCTPSSTTIFANSSACGCMSIMFTPKGLFVSCLQRRMFSRRVSAFMPPAPIMPKAPALEQAAANSPVAMLAMPP